MKNTALMIAVFEAAVVRGTLSNQDLEDYKGKKKQFKSDDLFIRKQLTGLSGVVEFINENDVKKNCITNLSKGSVPADKNIIIDKIGMRFGYSATNVDASTVAYSNAVFNLGDTEFDAGAVATGSVVNARVIPLQIQNAEYELAIDGVLLDSGRVGDLLTQNVSTDATNGDDKNFKQLEWPILALADKRVTLSYKFPEGAMSVPAGFFYAEVTAKGLGLGKRQAQ